MPIASHKNLLRYLTWEGLPILVEVEAGDERSGINTEDPEGPPAWVCEHANAYGRIPGTLGADGEQLDVYLGEEPLEDHGQVFIITQLNSDGEYDEDKAMIGFPDVESAKQAYLNHLPAEKFGDITAMTTDDFKHKYVANQKVAFDAGTLVRQINDLGYELDHDSFMHSETRKKKQQELEQLRSQLKQIRSMIDPVKQKPDYTGDDLMDTLEDKIEDHVANDEELRETVADRAEETASLVDLFLGKDAEVDHGNVPEEREEAYDLRITETKKGQEVWTPNGTGKVEDVWGDGKYTLVRLDSSGELKPYNLSRLRAKEAVKKIAADFNPGTRVQLKPEWNKVGTVLYPTPYGDVMVAWQSGGQQRVNPDLLTKLSSKNVLAAIGEKLALTHDEQVAIKDALIASSDKDLDDEDDLDDVFASVVQKLHNSSENARMGADAFHRALKSRLGQGPVWHSASVNDDLANLAGEQPPVVVVVTNPDDLGEVFDVLDQLMEEDAEDATDAAGIDAEVGQQMLAGPEDEESEDTDEVSEDADTDEIEVPEFDEDSEAKAS